MSRFPDNKHFAFTIFDDTDLSTVDNVRPVYRLLAALGMHTTKSVWPLASLAGARYGGASLQDRDYLKFVLALQESGFEIALHNVRNTHSTREQVEQGLEEFRNLLGRYPRAHANHSSNRENIYWGAARFTKLAPLYRAVTALRRAWVFEGHEPTSRYFWGDLCQARVEYVRNFVVREINLDHVNPSMPYYDPQRRFVNTWFSSADGGDVRRFCDLLSEANQDCLEAEGGVCIVYTHFACGFVRQGEVDPRAAALLRRLSKKNGWFVPVSMLLDHLREQRGTVSIADSEIGSMERRWLMGRLSAACSALGRWRAHPKPVPELSSAPA